MRHAIRNNWRPGTSLFVIFLCCCLLASGCKQRETTPQAQHAAPAPETYAGTIIAAGDSLTAGLGVAREDAWPALLEKKLGAHGLSWRVINAGISGETSSGMRARSKWLLAQHPEIVIVATGANDGLRGIPPELIRENISRTVGLFREGGVTVILAGMQIVSNLGEEYAGAFRAIYPAVAAEQQVSLIPFLLAGVAAEPALNQEDTIHPNEQGHRLIAETVYPYVAEAIRARR